MFLFKEVEVSIFVRYVCILWGDSCMWHEARVTRLVLNTEPAALRPPAARRTPLTLAGSSALSWAKFCANTGSLLGSLACSGGAPGLRQCHKWPRYDSFKTGPALGRNFNCQSGQGGESFSPTRTHAGDKGRQSIGAVSRTKNKGFLWCLCTCAGPHPSSQQTRRGDPLP